MTEDQYWKNTNGQESMVPRLAVAAAKGFEKLTQLGLMQIKTIPALNLGVFKITSKKSLQEVIQACQEMSFVEYVEPNQQFRTQ